jgi:zinc transporter ZupT
MKKVAFSILSLVITMSAKAKDVVIIKTDSDFGMNIAKYVGVLLGGVILFALVDMLAPKTEPDSETKISNQRFYLYLFAGFIVVLALMYLYFSNSVSQHKYY